MTYKQMTRKIQTAGTWFTGVFMGEILYNYSQINNDSVKTTEFIRYMHEEYGKNLDYKFDSTKTKCYAILSIVRKGCVLEALEYVIESNDKKVDADAKENATALLNKISKNEIILP